MKKRIYINMLIVCITCITVISLLLSFVFYDLFAKELKQQLQQSATNLSRVLQTQQNPQIYLEKTTLSEQSYRITLISKDGSVLYDNYKNTNELNNHNNRPEILDALTQGQGQSDRFSLSLNKQTHYYAIKLDNGQIIRVAKTTDNIFGIFLTTLPYILLTIGFALSICFIISIYLTKKIIQPINDLQINSDNTVVYTELEPFIDKIKTQKNQITAQIQELETKASTIQTIIKDMKEGLIFLDKTGSIISINDSTCALFKKTAEQCLGQNILTLTRHPDIIDNVKCALEGKKTTINQTIDEYQLEMFFNPVQDDNNITGALILFIDITDKAAADKIRREFSANVSHELKTPLTTILGFSEMLASDMIKPQDIKPFASKIHDQVLKLIKLIENIIKISQLDEKLIQTDFEQFDLLELTNQIIDNFKPLANKNNITLSAVGSSTIVCAHKTMLTELLTNLIDNAIKYNHPTGSVTVALSFLNTTATISVTDTGIGIEQKHHKRVFERFYRVDPSRSTKTGGTGLGLSIVKNIAKYHGGNVQIDSQPNLGTTITVQINAS